MEFGVDLDIGGLFGVPNRTGTPERRLLLAVLERAVLDYVGNDQEEFQTAHDWIFGDLDDPKPGQFSFPWICQQLDLDYSRIAAKIKCMPRRGASRVAPWYFSKEVRMAS